MSAALAAVAATAVVPTLLLATAVEATHAVDHYVVLGYVRDATGRPVSRTVVRVVREKTGLGYEARTDGDGFYLVLLHVHDEDVLEIRGRLAGRASTSSAAWLGSGPRSLPPRSNGT